jgi:MoxR-like ATPase
VLPAKGSGLEIRMELFDTFDKEETTQQLSDTQVRTAKQYIDQVVSNIETVIHGKHEKVELTVLCMLAEGHVLIEDIPGTGKTSLVSTLAKSIACQYSRIQFTPDVMPSDISGFSIFNQKTGEFEFRKGAAMSNIVLADEINRASAKTQSAMLEIMQERQVTVDGVTRKLQAPFMVLATQNPIESLGTYQLPEAQIDRFMVKFSMGYPTHADELDVVLNGRKQKSRIQSVITSEQVLNLVQMARQVRVNKQTADYMVNIVEATRTDPNVKLGSSPRGSIALYDLSKAYALAQGRSYVIPDDVKYLAPYVLSHRLILTHTAKTERKRPEDIIQHILGSVLVPVMS